MRGSIKVLASQGRFEFHFSKMRLFKWMQGVAFSKAVKEGYELTFCLDASVFTGVCRLRDDVDRG